MKMSEKLHVNESNEILVGTILGARICMKNFRARIREVFYISWNNVPALCRTKCKVLGWTPTSLLLFLR